MDLRAEGSQLGIQNNLGCLELSKDDSGNLALSHDLANRDKVRWSSLDDVADTGQSGDSRYGLEAMNSSKNSMIASYFMGSGQFRAALRMERWRTKNNHIEQAFCAGEGVQEGLGPALLAGSIQRH